MTPLQEDVTAFKKMIKLEEANGNDDWLAVKAKGTLDFWNGKSEAREFQGPKPDPDAVDLRYKDKKIVS